MSWVDIAIVAIIVVSVLISVMRGFVREALSLAAWIVALWVGIMFAPALAEAFVPYIDSAPVRIGLAYFILFVGSLLIGVVAAFIITQLIQKTGLTGPDRVLGMVFGLGRGVLIVVLLLLVVNLTTLSTEIWWERSKLVPIFEPMAGWLTEFIPEATQDDLENTASGLPIPSV